jgi:hypothetical protein
VAGSILTFKLIVKYGYWGERLIDLSSSWFSKALAKALGKEAFTTRVVENKYIAHHEQ